MRGSDNPQRKHLPLTQALSPLKSGERVSEPPHGHLALAVAGAAAGSALLPAGVTIFGATLTGATLGAQAGALAGAFIDQALLAPSGHQTLTQGPRLSELRVTGSSEGAPIPRLYGRARLGGQIIWATNIEEEVIQQGSPSRGGNAPLGATVSAILTDYGFPTYDTGGLVGMLGGFIIDRILSAREALQPLELAFFVNARESEGLIVFAHRGSESVVAELTPNDLVEQRPDAALATLTRAQETDLPSSAKLTFISGDGSYPPAVEEARRLVGHSGRVAVADLPIVLDAGQVAQMAEVWLFEAWAARERAGFALPPSRLGMEPGDMVSFAADGRTRLLRITEIGEHGARDIDARGIDPDVYTGAAPAVRKLPIAPPTVVGQPFVLFLDLPLLTGSEPPHAGYVAAAQSPWPGAIAFYRSPEDSNFLLKAIVSASAVTGTTLDPLPAGPISCFDRASKIGVQLDGGMLTSTTELALLAGANLAAVENAAGEWEVLQFQSAVLTAPLTYALSLFLRGQAGTEAAMRTPVAAGARFVLLDAAITLVDMGPDEIGLAYTWRCGPGNRGIGDPSYLQTTHAFQGLGLRPLSPVHVRGSRSAGDLSITWARRTRIGGDSWDAVEVPLGEESERYEIDILDGADVLRTLASTTPTAAYTAAEQTTDFGAPQSSIDVRIYQLSTVFGRGTPHSATV